MRRARIVCAGGEAPLARALGLGLLVAAGTAASLAAADLHGILIAVAISGAAAATGIVAWVNALKKKPGGVTLAPPGVTEGNHR
jgi:hypothetical protein